MKKVIRWFCKTKQGAVLLFIGGVAVAAPFVQRATTAQDKARKKAKDPLPKVAEVVRDKTLTEDYTEKLPFSAAKTASPKEAEVRSLIAAAPPVTRKAPLKFLPVQVYAGDYQAGRPADGLVGQPSPHPDQRGRAAQIEADEPYAPFGRLLPCELTLTLESSKIDTPILGLVTKDLWWNGQLIIPANSEVHGTARADRTRERIASTGVWTIVLAKGGSHVWGTELLLNGIALDMASDPDVPGAWDMSDGSAGLRGKVLTSTSSKEELSLFAATALSAAANGVIPKASNIFGQQVNVAGAETAFGQAAAAVADRYAERILAKITEEGWYTQVPAGKPFYLYVRQAILPREARLGASLGVAPTGQVQPDANENKRTTRDPLAELIDRAHAPRAVAAPAPNPVSKPAPLTVSKPKAAPRKTMIDASLFPKP